MAVPQPFAVDGYERDEAAVVLDEHAFSGERDPLDPTAVRGDEQHGAAGHATILSPRRRPGEPPSGLAHRHFRVTFIRT